jgi:rRNA processing protein Krr1/Pno1/FtsZ-interacting cell division protein ZipA
MDSLQLSPRVVGVIVAVVVAVVVTVLLGMRSKKDTPKAASKNTKKSAPVRDEEESVKVVKQPEPVVEKKAEKAREVVDNKHVDKKEKATDNKSSASASAVVASVAPTDATENAAVESKVVKKKHRKSKKVGDADEDLIALFEKGKKSNKNKSEKSKQRKRHPKLVGAAGGYNVEDSEEDDEADQIIGFAKQHTASAPAASSSASAGPTEVTPSMKAAAVETQFFVTSEDPPVSSTPAVSSTALEIANLKQLDLPPELEASLIAGLPTNESTDGNYFVARTTRDGWAVVEDKRRVRMTKKQEAAAAATSAGQDMENAPMMESLPTTAIVTPSPAPLVIDITKSQIAVEAGKVGLIVGPKGATLKALQEVTGVEIIAPRYRDVSDNKDASTVTIHLVGPAEGVSVITKAIEELCAKGYTAVLEGPDFGETTVSIHAQSVADIIGKGGSTRRILQEQMGVRVIIPNNNSVSGGNLTAAVDSNVKVTIAGPRMKVSETKKLIKELVRYHHTAVTHPGVAHVEYDASHMFFNFLNTCRGSEIRTIQTNYKVTVFIPNENSVCKNILIVGEVDNIAGAQLHLQKQVERAAVDKSAAAILSDAWSATAVEQGNKVNSLGSATNITSIVANELGSSISNPWMGGLVSSPPVNAIGSSPSLSRNANAGAAGSSTGGWDPSSTINSAEGW